VRFVNEDTPMPKNKDLKRLVRARMAKTGEAYTAARAHVVEAPVARKVAANPKAPAAPAALDAGALEALAGMRDATITAKTGRGWVEWVATLDAAGAAAMNHTEVAALVHERFGVSGWWSQSVTVGYERIRGKRAKNQTTAGFAVSKSKTFPAPFAALVRAVQPDARAQWLGKGERAERRSGKREVVRWKEAGGAWVDVHLAAKGAGKTTVTVQVSRLASRDDVERGRAQWTAHLGALAEWLDAHR
jgi:hypothetical protein